MNMTFSGAQHRAAAKTGIASVTVSYRDKSKTTTRLIPQPAITMKYFSSPFQATKIISFPQCVRQKHDKKEIQKK
ncbi:hypothetical protein F6X50_11150 [Dickeya dianthicola]|uniref:hypothetical protein n=1 Tax=Dickeya dianthicola TaxID=204039 RepID=UPI00136F8F74|nr:hypothetical protein [Dickeya dianthicola]MCI4235882.1 hypothetical protein [Dickeya dianthicola]MCI4253855.1 hypothetical protein [Dickeya dianthicola]MZG20902.1 hypothetical protein [Dickeya dianthicola]MZI89645.1 hypothetical protein [Dickeya dianthicola]